MISSSGRKFPKTVSYGSDLPQHIHPSSVPRDGAFDSLDDLIDEAIKLVQQKLSLRSSLGFEVDARLRPCPNCAQRVEGGGTPQGQLDAFLEGLSDLFGSFSFALPPNVSDDELIGIAVDLNEIVDFIFIRLATVQNWPETKKPRLKEKIARQFAQKLLGDIADRLELIPDDVSLAIVRPSSYPNVSFRFRVSDVPSSIPKPRQQAEIESLRESLIAAERKAEDLIRELLESRRKELEGLQTIASLQQEISRLTRLVCELKAENQGFRDQLERNRLPLEAPEPIDEDEKFPVGTGEDPLEWLRTHYGHRLTYFGASRDTLFQYELRARDPGLVSSLENKLSYERRKRGGTGTRLREIVPTKADRNSQKLAVVLAGAEVDHTIPYIAAYRLQKQNRT